MTFEWSYDVLLYYNQFPSPLCVYVFVSQKKKKNYELESSYVIYSYILISLLSFFHVGL